jgi:putative ABC transport system permease protein
LRWPSFLLSLLAVTVGATVAATMLNLKSDLKNKMSRELRRYGPNLLVTPAPGPDTGTASPTLAEEQARRLPSLLAGGDGGAAVLPLLIATGSIAALEEPQRPPSPAAIVGADFVALRLLYPGWRVEGAWPAAAPAGTVPPCLVGVALARRAGLAPGRPASLRAGSGEIQVAIVGVVSTGEPEDDRAFVPLAVLQERTGLAGRVSLAALSLDGGPEAVERAAHAVRAAMPGSIVLPLRPITASQGAILGKLDRMMVLLTLVILVLSMLCLATTLLAMVAERESEIGLMRSIGAGDGEVLGMFLGEVGILGALGALLGLGLGAVGARLIGLGLFGAAIEARAGVVPVVLGGSLALCLAAALAPLRRALAVQPAAALRGE